MTPGNPLMNLGQLLLELKQLLAEPSRNRRQIVELLEKNAHFAESEVARFYVATHPELAQDLEPELSSRDPRTRFWAVKCIDSLMPPARASRLLRLVAKDPDMATRSHARRKLSELRLADVSLPDTRFDPGKRAPTPRTIGAWNPTGWAFGLYRRKFRRTQPELLKKHDLPALRSVEDVLALLGIPGAKELRALQRPGAGTGAPYVEFEIAKASGGKRTITAPRAALRRVQRRILTEILNKVDPAPNAHGFVRGRSTVSNAAPHVNAKLVLKLDLVDFFPTIHFRRALGLFQWLGYDDRVARVLASLCTFRPVLEGGRVAWPGILPQGAPTSPALANLVCRRLDRRLDRLAREMGGTYTRYADDLTFSFVAEPRSVGRFLWWVDQICQQEGFRENTKKRRVLRRKNQQRVTGVVVNEKLAIPRRERRRFRAILANVKKNGLEAEARGREDFADYLRGYAAYVHMVAPELGARWLSEVARLTQSTE
jgi:RNA-directed DNA polymerase